jgi:3-oxoacyl-[acyl-carrier-protein] synthase-1
MRVHETYIAASHILSPLGNGTKANWQAIRQGRSGVAMHHRQEFRNQPLCAALFSPDQWQDLDTSVPADFTPFEKLLAASLQGALQQTGIDVKDPRTLLLLASTKGNIGLLRTGEPAPQALTSLQGSAKKIGGWLQYHSDPIVVSNACISGMTALLTAKRFMDAGLYDHAVVAGADCISPFIVAGFRSFQALSDEVCKPFDANRKGINLGEGAATIILSKSPSGIRLSGGSSSSDANHISGPSRTGAEMAEAISTALERAGVAPAAVGGIAAHGTATPFNDEMESKAFMLSGLGESPAFSLKAHFGHTLGAAGLLESAIAIEALEQGLVPASTGYEHHGVTAPVRISTGWSADSKLAHIVKTGSGFGGCNAALVFSKI